MKHNVLPLDDRQIERINSDMAGRPVLVKGNSQILLAGMGRLSENSVIDIKNKSFDVGGWCLYAKGGTVTLYCDGKEIGKGRVEQTQGFIFSADETTDIGYESGTTVSPDYSAHTNRFNGRINWVQIDLGDDARGADHYIDQEERVRVVMARQ